MPVYPETICTFPCEQMNFTSALKALEILMFLLKTLLLFVVCLRAAYQSFLRRDFISSSLLTPHSHRPKVSFR